jgi:hypothetical protein
MLSERDPMRYDKWAQADAVLGKPRADVGYAGSGMQECYDEHYDHILSMLAQDVDPRRLTYSDPDLRRTPEDYAKFPIVDRLIAVELPNGTQRIYCHQYSSEEDILFSYDFKAKDDNGYRYNIPGSLRYIYRHTPIKMTTRYVEGLSCVPQVPIRST